MNKEEEEIEIILNARDIHMLSKTHNYKIRIEEENKPTIVINSNLEPMEY